MANPRALLICMMIICRGSCALAGRTIMMMTMMMMMMGCTQNPMCTKSHIWDFVHLYGMVFVINVIIIIMIIKSEGVNAQL